VNAPLVVIPTYNEATNIGPLIDEILSLPSRFEILVVDDSSPDGTSALVEGHPAFGDRVHILKRPRKQGLGKAYREGFGWALARKYETICHMDADFSHNPKDLERLLEKAKDADLVLGTRYIPEGRTEGWPLRRLLLSRAANLYARIVTGLPPHDLTGGFKCYRREALASLDLSSIRSEGYAFQIETTAHVARKGLSVRELPIVFRERSRGASKISRRIVWEAVWLVLRLGKERFV